MSRIYILGTSSAIPREGYENTHFLIEHGERKILVDCGSNPVLHLSRAGVALDEITDIVMTHFHPDHVSGLPLLLMDMWLLKRRKSSKYLWPWACNRAIANCDGFIRLEALARLLPGILPQPSRAGYDPGHPFS